MAVRQRIKLSVCVVRVWALTGEDNGCTSDATCTREGVSCKFPGSLGQTPGGEACSAQSPTETE